MRIIDKNYDFYDYLQDYNDDSIVFDRRGSFLLEKKHICNEIYSPFDFHIHNRGNKYHHLLLQCGGTFWIFLITVTEYIDGSLYAYPFPSNYSVELLNMWKNYDKPNKLIDIRLINFSGNYIAWDRNKKYYILEKDKIDPEWIRQTVDRRSDSYDDKDLTTLSTYKWKNSRYEKNIRRYPLLYACGISDSINPIDIFCAIEEYFSREKTASERTEPIGATNNDKIVMHGFDTKTSFRGKTK